MQDRELFAHAGLAFGGEALLQYAELPLEETQLRRLAEQMTGLADWGADESFRAGLNVLIEDIERQAPSAANRHLFRRQIVHLLNQRLRLREDERREAQIVATPIDRPLVVIGLPRTGTTLAHQLLSLDPASRYPRNWEYAAPWPAPQTGSFDTDPRIARVDASWQAQREASPELETMLPTFARMPSECNDAMMYHFAGPCFWAWMGAFQHGLWTAEATPPGLYRTHRRILQQLQWQGPRGRWVLKSPAFISDLEAILEAYPDACLIWTHRDPSTSFVSLASLISSIQNALLGRRPDPAAIGAQCRRLWTIHLRRSLEQRKNPKVAQALLDVRYSDLVTDKVGTVANIYAHFGLQASEELRRRIAAFEQEQPSSQFAKHRYTAQQYGLEASTIRRELKEYYDAFGPLL